MKEVYYIVNGKKITQDEVHDFVHSMGQEGMRYHNEEGFQQIADELLNQELFLLEAKDKGFDKEENYLKEVEFAKEQILKQYAIRKLLDSVNIDDEKVKEFYESNKDQFSDIYKFAASHILVENQDLANELKEKIDNGESFEDVATENSTCPSSQRGGDLGEFQSGQMVKEFENALLEMENGEISNPVKTQFGYHIIKLNKKELLKENKFESFKDELERSLLSQLQQEAYANKAEELKNKYTVERGK